MTVTRPDVQGSGGRPGAAAALFGGNPLACAIGREVIAMLATGEFQERSAKLGTHLHDRLSALPREAVREVRGRGLWAGVGLRSLDGRTVCERLARLGVLAKDTHGSTIRLGPPLTVSEPDLDWALDRLEEALR
jgi:ornithine--oxo-acid transaminase